MRRLLLLFGVILLLRHVDAAFTVEGIEQQPYKWLRTLSTQDFKKSGSPLMEWEMLRRIEKFGGVYDNMTRLNMPKAFMLYVIDNKIYAERAASKNRWRWYAGLNRLEEVLAMLYDCMLDLTREHLRVPDVQIGLVLHDVGLSGAWSFESKAVVMVISRPAVDIPNSVQLLLPGPEFIRPRTTFDTFPRSNWLHLLRNKWIVWGQDLPERYRFENKYPQALWRGSMHGQGLKDESGGGEGSDTGGGDARESAKNGTKDGGDGDEKSKTELLMPRALLLQMAEKNPELINATGVKRANEKASAYIDFMDFNQWKVLLDLDGFGWSERFQHLLRTSSVVVKMKSDYQDLLTLQMKPDVHYVEFARDFHDLPDKIREVVKWDRDKYQSMVRAAHTSLVEMFNWDEMKKYFVELLVRYASLQKFDVKLPPYLTQPYVPCYALNSEVGCTKRGALFGKHCAWLREKGICAPSFRAPYLDAWHEKMTVRHDGLLEAGNWRWSAARLRFSGTPIFLMWTNRITDDVSVLPTRVACAVEAVARQNPNSPVVLLSEEWSWDRRLERFDNVMFSSFNLDSMFEGTPLYNFVMSRQHERLPWPHHLLADLCRYAVLYKFGGIFMDTDFLSLRPFDAELVKEATVGLMSPKSGTTISNGVMVFPEPRHTFLLNVMQNLKFGSEADRWGYFGHLLLTKTNEEQGPFENLRVAPYTWFFPLLLKELRQSAQPGWQWHPPENSYTMHMWNSFLDLSASNNTDECDLSDYGQVHGGGEW